jgi:decaprenyl-phosphate phosphoribosyltransferase
MTTPTTSDLIASRTTLAGDVVRLIRPKQWIKNAFVFAPLIFSGHAMHTLPERRSLIAFIAFCMASSIGYVVNDLCDVERDRLHPLKCFSRPIASGAISKFQARLIIGVLALVLVGLVLAFELTPVVPALSAYMLLTFLYSFKLKQMPIVDLFAIASGFVLRVYAGAEAIHVPVSFWMFATTFCLALYLACIKRRQELVLHGANARGTLGYYSAPLLSAYALIATMCSVNFYGFYLATVLPRFSASLAFVLFGFFRYQYLVDNLGEGESPTEAIWKDPYMFLTVLAWGIFAVIILK